MAETDPETLSIEQLAFGLVVASMSDSLVKSKAYSTSTEEARICEFQMIPTTGSSLGHAWCIHCQRTIISLKSLASHERMALTAPQRDIKWACSAM